MTLSWAVVNWAEPRRLAGTWKQYSRKAIPQLASTTIQSGELLKLRCPYQAKVMKTLETMRRKMGSKGPPASSASDAQAQADLGEHPRRAVPADEMRPG